MIKSIMSKNLVTVTPDNTISDAINLMDKNRYKELPVVDEKNKVLGMVTYNNILSVVKFKGASKIKHFIEGVPIVNESDSEEYVLGLMIDTGLMGLPVIDDDDNLNGFISDYDLIQFYQENLKDLPLTDVNVKKVPSVNENASLGEVKNILHFNKRDRLPVINDKGEFIGTILSIDILRRIHKGESNNEKNNIVAEKSNIFSTSIKDMVRKGLSINFNSDLYDTSKSMLSNQVLGLILTNSKNQPIGAVDRCSILKLIKEINADKEIEIEIVGQVNQKALFEIKRIIKTQLKLLPSYESSIKKIKVFIKRVHNDQNDGKVEIKLTIQRDGQKDINIEKTDYDILMTLMDCVDKVNSILKNKIRK